MGHCFLRFKQGSDNGRGTGTWFGQGWRWWGGRGGVEVGRRGEGIQAKAKTDTVAGDSREGAGERTRLNPVLLT